MSQISSRVVLPQVIFAMVCLALIGLEAHIVLVARDDTFSIEGQHAYEITEFAAGGVVSHAFLMRGDGMHAVGVRLSSDAAASVRLRWTLWHGFADQPPMMRAFEGEESLAVRAGRQWVTFTVPRDGSSHNRWCTIELQLLDAVPVPARPGSAPAPRPHVSVVASRDNPDRGGVLWVNDVRQPGSLFLRADRRGKTLYRRFLVEAAPNLPAIFRIPLVQWLIVAAYHWAFIVFAYAVMSEARTPSVSHRKS